MTTETPLTEAATSNFVRIKDESGGYNIHYNDCGHGSETVVMLHGSGPGATGWANFHRNVGPIVDAGYRVVLIDCPGWGKSDTVICTSSRSDLNARVSRAVLDELGIKRAHFIGNSMGGHSAVAFALSFPERAGHLILMGGGTGGPSQFVPMPTEGIKLIQGVYRDPTVENMKKMMSVFIYDSSSMTEDLLRARLENMLGRRDHLENFVKSLAANPKQFPDYGYRLGEVKSKTQIIWGRDDRFVPFDIGLRLLWGIPNADMTIFSHCGHWAQWEHADKFNRLAIEFLGR